ncbi:LysR family transcriptional regulator [Bacillus halotolerans]|uniref:LysR family transcriptional regulator n=1 Tax=Bacillus TaxID=1386 RepID=UPI00084B1855|nr:MULTISPECIES: LysR family transcriptional regulator [Bacillus]OEC79421.1 LysR family transcriptional regulator [Bacillus halotolerans]PHI46924.1 LysR family transcriptional regulator [Bacillus halotolerans]UZD50775.1 LysR family transcriptional regulator [Bacillus halotolerans]WEY44430.1 LysR family transcriptional regulator [Bacillus sp. B28]
MESGDLRVFQMVAREGTITKAALQLGYVQSNVTARIQQLEAELGTTLFLRHNRGMTLSSSGKLLLDYTDKIIGLLDEASKALSSSVEPSGPLMIGSTQTTAAVRLPKLLAAYYEEHPNVQLSLTTGHTQFLIDKVLRYELDGAFIGCECNHPELKSYPAFEEEPVVVSAASVSNAEEAITKPILVYSTGCSYRETLEKWLHSVGVTQPVIMEFGTLEAIIGGVIAGLGISLLPRTVVQKHEFEGSIRLYTLPEALRQMKTEFIVRKDSFISSALRTFMDSFAPDKTAASQKSSLL